MIPSFTEFYLVLPSFRFDSFFLEDDTEFYRVLPSFRFGSYFFFWKVILGSGHDQRWSRRVLPSFFSFLPSFFLFFFFFFLSKGPIFFPLRVRETWRRSRKQKTKERVVVPLFVLLLIYLFLLPKSSIHSMPSSLIDIRVATLLPRAFTGFYLVFLLYLRGCTGFYLVFLTLISFLLGFT